MATQDLDTHHTYKSLVQNDCFSNQHAIRVLSIDKLGGRKIGTKGGSRRTQRPMETNNNWMTRSKRGAWILGNSTHADDRLSGWRHPAVNLNCEQMLATRILSALLDLPKRWFQLLD